MSTSFQKKARVKIGQIPGTRPSLYNKQLLISSGIPSLDSVIGGGLGVGTVMMVEEDVYGNYARLLMKYFVAEAVMTHQSVLLASAESDPQQLVTELPLPIESNAKPTVQQSRTTNLSSPSSKQMETTDQKMKIAWRYENQPAMESSPAASAVSFGHYYDLTKTMGEDRVQPADITFSDPLTLLKEGEEGSECRCPIEAMNPHYVRLLQDIRARITAGNFGTDCDVKDRRVLRIGIHAIGSPVWLENGGVRRDGSGGTTTGSYDPSLALFLLALKSMLRSAMAVAVVTVPTHLFQDESHASRLYGMCDTVVGLDSFAGSDREKNPVFKEYHGLFRLVQLPRVNSLVPTQPETLDLAFKLRRKKFTIEKLHLPPELSETTSRAQEDGTGLLARKSGTGCGSSSSSLDF